MSRLSNLNDGMNSNRNRSRSKSETKTVVLRHKLEKLKGMKVYSQMLIIGEPIIKNTNHKKNATMFTNVSTEEYLSF